MKRIFAHRGYLTTAIVLAFLAIGIFFTLSGVKKSKELRGKAAVPKEQGSAIITFSPENTEYILGNPATIAMKANIQTYSVDGFQVVAYFAGIVPNNLSFTPATIAGLLRVKSVIEDVPRTTGSPGAPSSKLTLAYITENPESQYSGWSIPITLGNLSFTPLATGSMQITYDNTLSKITKSDKSAPLPAEQVKDILAFPESSTLTFSAPTPTPTPTVTPTPMPTNSPTPTSTTIPTPTPTPYIIGDTQVNKSVLLLVFDPVLEAYGNKKVSQYFGWNNPDTLTNGILATLPAVSKNYVSYTIKERIDIDGIFPKSDGYQYTDASYVSCIQKTGPCHSPDIINYERLFNEYNICSKNVDEVWMWGGPYFGYWEFALAPYCGKTTFTMGFSYERTLAEALHDFGHRTEHVGTYRVGNGNWQQNETTEWNKFSLIAGHCGNIHYPPGTVVGSEEYKYDKTASVSTDCNGYLSYPDGPFPTQSLTCSAWGCTSEGYMRWWLSHIPNATGITTKDNKSIYNNWWKYYAFYDETNTAIPSVTPTPEATPTPSPSFTPTPTPFPTPTPTPSFIINTLTKPTNTIPSPTPTPTKLPVKPTSTPTIRTQPPVLRLPTPTPKPTFWQRLLQFFRLVKI